MGFARPVIRDSSSSEPGDCSSMTRSNSRFPLERSCANDSMDVNHTFGLPSAGFSSPRAIRMVRAFISS
nr:hypothetical protein TR92_18250 [Brucella anthropi]